DAPSARAGEPLGGGRPARRGGAATARGARGSAPGARLRHRGRAARRARGARVAGAGHAGGPAPRAGRVIVYGRNPVREALRGPRTVARVWADDGAAREAWLREAGPRRADDAELESLCGSPDHQGVCAEVSEFEYAAAGSLLRGEDALVLCLDQVTDPRNLGAVCRVAETAGAAGVVIGERRSAQVTPVVCRTSAGAVEHLPVARVRNLADYLGDAKQEGAWVYGASTAPEAVPYD